jgi:hypothetical protein
MRLFRTRLFIEALVTAYQHAKPDSKAQAHGNKLHTVRTMDTLEARVAQAVNERKQSKHEQKQARKHSLLAHMSS